MTEDRHLKWSCEASIYLPVPRIGPRSTVFLGECGTHLAIVSDI